VPDIEAKRKTGGNLVQNATLTAQETGHNPPSVYELREDRKNVSYLPHCTVLIELEPIIDGPLATCPVRIAEVSPHLIPVSCI
jgi:hypothetical protein